MLIYIRSISLAHIELSSLSHCFNSSWEYSLDLIYVDIMVGFCTKSLENRSWRLLLRIDVLILT